MQEIIKQSKLVCLAMSVLMHPFLPKHFRMTLTSSQTGSLLIAAKSIFRGTPAILAPSPIVLIRRFLTFTRMALLAMTLRDLITFAVSCGSQQNYMYRHIYMLYIHTYIYFTSCTCTSTCILRISTYVYVHLHTEHYLVFFIYIYI